MRVFLILFFDAQTRLLLVVPDAAAAAAVGGTANEVTFALFNAIKACDTISGRYIQRIEADLKGWQIPEAPCSSDAMGNCMWFFAIFVVE